MKKTTRTDVSAVSLSAANGEQLEYRLKISGARANFAWVDRTGGILTHQDFGMVDEIVWQLKAALDAGGKVDLTVPQKPTYSRTVSVGTANQYTLSLFFVTAVAYTLTVKRLDSAGAAIQTVTDIDFTMEQETDHSDQGLAVGL